ncbi:SIS domain-containing protein [Streptomyces tendae]|uniref:SIS domain-containing protein n=1 Tax=Streptomyces tendae TaxID=1932 RepID=UPI003645F867
MTGTTEQYAPESMRACCEKAATRYFQDLVYEALRIDTYRVAEAMHRIVETISAGKTVFVAGNGGSAAAASHMVCDLATNAVRAGYQSVKIKGIADNLSLVTALANDNGFQSVFSHEINASGEPGDLLVILSVSGSSENLLEAAKAAKKVGVSVVGILGCEGVMEEYCDSLVLLGGGDYGLTEDLHMAFNHAVVRILHGGLPRTVSAPDRAERTVESVS